MDEVDFRFPEGTLRLHEIEIEAIGRGTRVLRDAAGALLRRWHDSLCRWELPKLATGHALRTLLIGGALRGLVGPDGEVRPAALELLRRAAAADDRGD